jgi:hypothetical protein
MASRGVPVGLDVASALKVERSFLIVRLVRGSLLLLFLTLALLAVEIKHWPTGVAVAIGLAVMLQAALLALWLRRLHTITR